MVTRLCLEFEAKGGGYLKAKDLKTNTVQTASPFSKTLNSRRVCYRFDNVPPEHCSVSGSCSSEPLHIDQRISKAALHTVTFSGWNDPVPSGGADITASKIESYAIRVNEVVPSNGTHEVDFSTNILSMAVNHPSTELTLNLTYDRPRLYCLTLEVKDAADNVQKCRRFLLIDNSSTIALNRKQTFYATTASPATDFTWQTNHNEICLSWKDYFANTFYRVNQLLNGIKPDHNGQITGKYEQISGELPVYGTPNIHGIVKYMISWKLNNGRFSPETEVPNFREQIFCKLFNPKDGDAFNFIIRPIDIVGNTINESRTVFIDSSEPFLNDLSIQDKTNDENFTHVNKDSEPLVLDVETYDNHSGISALKWVFGKRSKTNDTGDIDIKFGDIQLVNTCAFCYFNSHFLYI